MVAVEMGIAKGVDKLAHLQAADLSDHHGKQGIAGDVKRHAEKDVGAALVELAGEFAGGNVKLKHGVAGRQRHFIDQRGIPSGNNQTTAVGVAFDLLDQIGDLVDAATIGRRPAAPLVAVNRAEFAVFVGPFVPDGYVIFVQIFDVGVAAQKPQQLVDDGAQVQFFGGEKREAILQLEAHLVAEHRAGAGAGAVGFVGAVFENVAHQVEIGFHRRGVCVGTGFQAACSMAWINCAATS